jgi:hypothetical protein
MSMFEVCSCYRGKTYMFYLPIKLEIRDTGIEILEKRICLEIKVLEVIE